MSTTRERLEDRLREIGMRFPDWRYGQLIVNIANVGPQRTSVANVTDEELLANAEHFLGLLSTDREARNEPANLVHG